MNPRIGPAAMKRPLATAALQWGRGCEPADRKFSSEAVFNMGLGFNGAAGVNPRIDSCSCRRVSFWTAASMGPRV